MSPNFAGLSVRAEESFLQQILTHPILHAFWKMCTGSGVSVLCVGVVILLFTSLLRIAILLVICGTAVALVAGGTGGWAAWQRRSRQNGLVEYTKALDKRILEADKASPKSSTGIERLKLERELYNVAARFHAIEADRQDFPGFVARQKAELGLMAVCDEVDDCVATFSALEDEDYDAKGLFLEKLINNLEKFISECFPQYKQDVYARVEHAQKLKFYRDKVKGPCGDLVATAEGCRKIYAALLSKENGDTA